MPIHSRSLGAAGQTLAFLAAVAAGFVGYPPPAQAESLVFKQGVQSTPETAWVVRRPGVAFRYLGRLQSADAADYFSVTLKRDQKLEISLETPTADGAFRPLLVFFGPGIGRPKEDPVIPIGEPNGALVLRQDKEQRDSYFDRLTLTDYYRGPSLKFTAPRDATYGIAIRSPKGESGRYVLRFSGQDEFDWRNIVDFLVNAFRAILRLY